MSTEITRRAFTKRLGFTVISGGGVLVSLPSTLRADDAPTGGRILTLTDMDVVAAYAHVLVPTLDPSDPRYRAVALKLEQSVKRDSDLYTLTRDGLSALGVPAGESWHGLSPQQRAARIGKQRGTPFFSFLRWTTSEIVMQDPALWQQLGYQGSAIEHGGYLHRGFDDIDWLPQAGSEIEQ